MKSLALTDTWDLCLTPSGSLATVEGSARAAQDVATACRTFKGECWFNQNLGIPYFEQILGSAPPDIIIRQKLEDEALAQPEVVEARAVLIEFKNRKLTGRIRIKTVHGESADVIL